MRERDGEGSELERVVTQLCPHLDPIAFWGETLSLDLGESPTLRGFSVSEGSHAGTLSSVSVPAGVFQHGREEILIAQLCSPPV